MERTDFDFIQELDDAEENRLESAVDPDPWHEREVARQPRLTSHKADKQAVAGASQ